MTNMMNPPLTQWDKGLNPSNEDSVPRRISNSEVSAYLQCEKKWEYGYFRNLQPVRTSQALSRGVIGHECLAAYYQSLMDEPGNHSKAEQAAMNTLVPYFSLGFDIEMLAGLRTLLERYFVYSKADGWNILAVEQSYDISVNDEFGYVMRLDLLAEINGKTVLVDHKFVYQMHDVNTLDLNCQMPKYIGALRFNDVIVDYALLNQILHRTKKGGYTDEEMFQRVVMRPSQVEIRNVLREQFKASQQIVRLYAQDTPDVLRTMNMMTCKNCSFAKVCKSDLMGLDTTDIIANEYAPNEYGYNKPAEEVDA